MALGLGRASRRSRRNATQRGGPPPQHRTDVVVGVLVSAAALVVGIVVFPLLPSGTSAASTAPPRASVHSDTPVASIGDPGPVGGQLAVQPSAPANVDRAPTRGGVALLSDQTPVHRASIPVPAQPVPAPQVAVPSVPSRSSYAGSEQPASPPQVRSVPDVAPVYHSSSGASGGQKTYHSPGGLQPVTSPGDSTGTGSTGGGGGGSTGGGTDPTRGGTGGPKGGGNTGGLGGGSKGNGGGGNTGGLGGSKG